MITLANMTELVTIENITNTLPTTSTRETPRPHAHRTIRIINSGVVAAVVGVCLEFFSVVQLFIV